MELKELIQNTVAELDEVIKKQKDKQEEDACVTKGEKEFLEFIKSRIEVLFLGLQAKDIENIEDKLEITLKFLEFLLAKIDERVKNK